MKIKIPPYPNFKITENAYKRDVLSDSIVSNHSSGIANQSILITQFVTGEKRVVKSRPVFHDGKTYVTAFPNPVHLFLSSAIEHFYNSEEIKDKNFPHCGKKYADDVYLLDFEESGTHDCYNNYIKYRVSSIIMLVSAIEAFLNHIIPNDFIYKTIRKEKQIEFDKNDIESTKVSFREKLIYVIPQFLDRSNFWAEINEEKIIILDLYENRKKIIHLKTESSDDFERYFNAIDKMLELNILKSINSVVRVMNLISENFIEYEN